MSDQNLLEVGRPYWTQGEDNEQWPLNASSIAYEAHRIVKTGPGKLYGFTVYNSGAAQFILLFDTSQPTPPSGVVAVPFAVAATSTLAVSFGDTGRAFNSGCLLVNSSTAPTLTVGAADCFFDAQYV